MRWLERVGPAEDPSVLPLRGKAKENGHREDGELPHANSGIHDHEVRDRGPARVHHSEPAGSFERDELGVAKRFNGDYRDAC